MQAEAIGGGSVEDEKDFDIRAKMLAKFFCGGGSIRVISISNDVALISGGDGGEDFGMNGGVVVAGKTAGWLHNKTNLAEWGMGSGSFGEAADGVAA